MGSAGVESNVSQRAASNLGEKRRIAAAAAPFLRGAEMVFIDEGGGGDAESSDRIPKFLLPVVHHRLAHGGEVRRSALVVAAWARYAEGADEQGQPIDVVDQRRDEVMERARKTRTEPLPAPRWSAGLQSFHTGADH